MLLLVIAAGLAVTIVTTLIKRDQSNPGIFINKWCEIAKIIENDTAGTTAAPAVTPGCN